MTPPHSFAIYICSECSHGLPAWEQGILSVLGVGLAFGILWGLMRIGSRGSRRRDARLRACFLGVQRAWGVQDAGRLTAYVTPALAEQLRGELAAITASGRVVHHEDPRIERFRVVLGGGRNDEECLARIESSVRHFLTDATSGEVVGGSQESSRSDVLWRFVRDPAHGWVAAEINPPPPGGRRKTAARRQASPS
jgi:hypothetical protein